VVTGVALFRVGSDVASVERVIEGHRHSLRLSRHAPLVALAASDRSGLQTLGGTLFVATHARVVNDVDQTITIVHI